MQETLTTPDGRYIVVRGRLLRRANPTMPEDERSHLVAELMSGRRAKGSAIKRGDDAAREAARSRVDAAKATLGERGPVWLTDGAPDLTRKIVKHTEYDVWFKETGNTNRECGRACACPLRADAYVRRRSPPSMLLLRKRPPSM